MFEVIFKIWYMVAILPLFIFLKGSKLLGDFLKKKKIYDHWDHTHSWLLLLIIVFIIIYFYKILK